MDVDAVFEVTRQALLLTVILSAPAVGSALVIGLAVSVFQAATQIQDQAIATVPRLVVVYGALAIAGVWMLRELVLFSGRVFEQVLVLSQ